MDHSWRTIPGYDKYEMNRDKEIRRKRKSGLKSVDKGAVKLQVDGKTHHRSVSGLYNDTFPDYWRG